MNRNTKENKKRKQEGITLVALIITIIVMLILLVVIVDVTVESGLFGHAKNAINKDEIAVVCEQMKMEMYDEKADLYNPSKNMQLLREKGIVSNDKNNIVNASKLIKSPTTGKGNLDDGDVYYLRDGDLYYLSKEKEEILAGKIFYATEEPTPDECFNYVVNENDEIEIIGLVFSEIPHTKIDEKWEYDLQSYIVKVETEEKSLIFPESIDGKKVTKISLEKHLDLDAPSKNVLILYGVKKVVLPSTLKSFEVKMGIPNVEQIVIPEGTTNVFLDLLGDSSIIIPKSVINLQLRATFLRKRAYNCVREKLMGRI